MVFPNDSHISDTISYKSEENMLGEPNHDQKPYVVLVGADFSNDPSRCDYIPNKFEETISEESNLDCKAQALDELDFHCVSDDFISTAVYPYHEVTPNVYSNQCEKYVLNEAKSFITCGYKDPTLFRGGG
ncbi:unnamed protein product [Schistosoma mattheei]|uniref:Uncharacterized protein n=1 Tax=Schistosoma mattheei TaxID=31246 RepID=A0A183NEA8_9TREM|nr:unnamed protein product [Schistosoma mattheei]